MRIRKEKNNRKGFRKSQLIIVGSLLILIGGFIVGGKYLYDYCLDKVEDIKIQEFYDEQENIKDETEEETPVEKESATETKIDYIAVLKIPKIKFEKGLCEKGTWCNNVNRNVQILDESSYPNIENGNFILAGHSGSGRTAYFKNVDQLKLDDEIDVIYKGYEYKYRIVNIYDIEKTGNANIIRNKGKTTLTLITCRHNTNKQIIVISELVERNEYNG